jgi:hypothetical protein
VPRGGFDLQTAIVGAAGGALAKFAVNQIAGRVTALSDPRIKGAAVAGMGVLLGNIKAIPSRFRGPLSLGAQITGATQVLAAFQPGLFGGIVPELDVSDLGVPVAGGVPMSLVETDTGMEVADFGASDLDQDLDEIPGFVELG